MPDLIQARAWYPQDDSVHGFEHMQRVYRMAERIAIELAADLDIVRVAALLHDATPPQDKIGYKRIDHHQIAADFAAELLQAEGWPAEKINAVQHAIRSHRFRNPAAAPVTLEAKILFDADKLDAIGAIGVARALLYAHAAGQPLFASPSPEFIRTGVRAPDEPHSAYHEYIFKLRTIKERLFTEPARRLAEARHTLMCAYFEQLAGEYSGSA